MTGKTFVDTNILLYAHDRDAGEKSEIATARIRELWEQERGVVSVQVLQEFFVNATRKIATPISLPAAREIIRAYRVWVRRENTANTVLRATELMELAQLSFWDALIVAAAEEAGANSLLSEDLNDGQVIAGIKVVNPFRSILHQ
ncbi:MAG: PIN domain-containing protein [Sulfuricella sp.]|nr:PIN domain-containing protein [Sulfuricella sp.]